MAQSLQDILSELDASYNPAKQQINQQINSMQGAQDADISGLQAQQGQAFSDITDNARSKGMGFSGIPIAEQAKYTSSSFLPAVAKVKQTYADNKNSLLSTLNNLGIDQNKTAMSIRDTQQQRDFQAQQAELDRQASARAASAANSSLGSLLGGSGLTAGGGGNTAAAADPTTVAKQVAQKEVMSVLNNHNIDQLTNYWKAISKSAGFGNQTDALKVQMLQGALPGIFKNGQLNSTYLAKAKQQGLRLF